MDTLCLKAGIPGIATPAIAASGNGDFRLSDKSSSVAQPRNSQWGFTFRHPLRSLWPVGKSRYEPAIAVDDAVSVDEKEDLEDLEREGRDANWVLKILHVRSLWKEEERDGELREEVELEEEDDNDNGDEICGDCEMCEVYDHEHDDGNDEKIRFDRESFSKLLRKVPLTEARLYGKMSYLGSLAYSIPQIKPGNLLRHHGFRFVTSSVEKKEVALKIEKERLLAEELKKQMIALAEAHDSEENIGNETKQDLEEIDENEKEIDVRADERTLINHVSPAAAYRIAASAASYLHSQTKNIVPFKSPNSKTNKDFPDMESVDMIDQDISSLIATTDSVTAVVSANEEVKQAVADDLKSVGSSPCEWFVCDDDHSATRFFVIQGSESIASWQANLLFEPIQFEGLDVLVHRGIYEAAKGMYEQMLPEIRSHINTHGEQATFRFTGHSLGGSLSLLVNLMLLVRGEVPRSSLLPVITFGAPSIMCGGDRLLRTLGLPRNHVRSIAMHRDIVPRAFSCNYPNHVAEFLKAVNRNFRSHPCLTKQKLLFAPMGEFLILQPDDKFSPNHDLLPSGSGLYILTCPLSDAIQAEKQLRAAQTVFLNSPHPLEILKDRSAYGSEGTIQRDHDMSSYLRSVRNVIRQDLNRIRKGRRENRRKKWWTLVTPHGVNTGLVVGRAVVSGNSVGQGPFNFSGLIQTGKESLKRFSTLVASQHMHLLVVLLFPAKLSGMV